jgi:hypothetical protein
VGNAEHGVLNPKPALKRPTSSYSKSEFQGRKRL